MTFRNIYDLAQETPDALALADPSEELSWAEVAERAARFARALLELRLPEGSRLAVLGHNRADTLLAYSAASLAGVGAILVNWHLTADEVEYLLRDGGAAAIWSSPEALDTAAMAAGRGDVPVLAREDGSQTWRSLYDAADASPLPTDLPAGTDLIYTSGTTGVPKGAEVPHRPTPTVADRLGVYAQHHSAGAGTHLVVGPLYHSGPHGSVGLLLTGSPVIVAGTFDADRVLRAIEDHRVATSVMVPTHFVRLLALPEARRREADVSSLRILAHTGSRCPIPLKQAMIDWVGPVLREAYGGGESGIIAYITSDDWLQHPGSVGRVQPPFRPLVVGDDGSPCQAGEDGVLYFVDETGRGIRYYHDPEATAAAHLEPGTFTLGDVGHVDADGYLYVTGRVTDMVISGGVNIYPAECERVLTEHPSVSEAALFGVPDDEMGERLVGLVALKHDDVTIQELLRHCRKSVAGYKVPKELRAVREVPRSPMGKVDKRAAREAYLAGRFDGDERR